MNARQQASLDKERKHIEDTIRRMQVALTLCCGAITG
jgi:hypothetical protein